MGTDNHYSILFLFKNHSSVIVLNSEPFGDDHCHNHESTLIARTGVKTFVIDTFNKLQ